MSCKLLRRWGLEQACKQSAKMIGKLEDQQYIICNEDGSEPARVREDPIFRGDVSVPEDIGRLA